MKISKDWNGQTQGVMLRFRDAGMEEKFRRSHAQLFMRLDSITTFLDLFGMVALHIKLMLSQDERLPWGAAYEVVATIIHRGAMIWLINRRHDFYWNRRTLLLWVMRLHVCIGSTRAMSKAPSPAPHPLSVILHMLSKSSINPMLLSIFAMPLHFREHLMVQSVATAANMLWASKLYCRALGSEGQQRLEWVQSLGEGIDYCVSRFSFFGVPAADLRWRLLPMDFSQHSCWVMVAFLYFTFGLVVPSALLYCWERRSRFKFLISHTSSNIEMKEQSKFFLETVCCTIWFSFMIFFMGWVVLEAIDKFSDTGC